ncbi:MAG: hypothetical protein H0S78_11660, partial [Tissierellales bacterium]|nr:hypothetical protein [Tissierellales bacterium]
DFNNQKSEAMVVCIIDETDISDAKIKYIIDIIDKLPIITENIITLVEWMREYYVCRYIDALKLFYPPSITDSYEYIINIKDIEYKGSSKVYNFLKRKESKTSSIMEVYEYFKSMDFTEDLYELHNMDIIEIYIKDNNKKKNKIISLNDKDKDFEDYNIRSNAYKQEKIIKHLMNIGEEIELNQLLKITNSNLSTIKSLKKEPDVLMFDEPTNNLDLKNQLEVVNIIKNIVKKNNISAVVTIHDLNMALRFADRFILLKDGRIFDAGGIEVINSKNIKEVYSVDVSIERLKNNVIVVPM